MKNASVGDVHDQLKYDLIEYLMNELEQLHRLVMVWMLTPDASESYGTRRTMRSPFPNARLSAFLKECPRDIAELRRYFTGSRPKGAPYTYLPYGERRYLDWNRAGYFSDLSADWLQGALVFFDPDTGMEPRSYWSKAWAPAKYLRYEDLAGAAGRMSKDSVALVFQYRYQGETASSFFPRIAALLKERVGLEPCWVNTGTVGFYAMTPSAKRLKNLRAVLAAYRTLRGYEGR